MNTGLLINTLVGNGSAGPALSKPAAAKNIDQSAPSSLDNQPSSNTSEATTADNNFADVQNELANKPSQEFSRPPDEAITNDVPRKTDANTKSKQQSPNLDTAGQPNVGWALAHQSLEPHGLKPILLAAGYAGLAKAHQNRESLYPGPQKLGQVVPATSQPENKPVNQIGLKAVLPNVSRSPLTAGTEQGTSKNTNKIPTLNRTVVTTNGFISQGSIPKSMTESPDADGKTATVGEKPAMTDKPAVSGGSKEAILDSLLRRSGCEGRTSFSAGQDKSTDMQQKVLAGLEKLALVAEKPTGNKADTVQQGRPSSPGPAESLNGNAEKPTGNKADTVQQGRPSSPGLAESLHGNTEKQNRDPSGESIGQKLNTTQVQIYANQTKGLNSSTSDNKSNPTNFEQILSGNNAQTPIAEQSSAPALASKDANNALPTEVSTSVSKQIQESIHSSLRHDQQQITIRLNPPELGKVSIKFHEQDGQIIGLLEVSRAQTRTEIQHALPQLIQNLAGDGVQIKRLEVLLTNQQGQQGFKNQSLATGADDWSGQGQTGANPDSPENNPDTIGTNEWLTNDSAYQNVHEPQEALITDSSINVLI